PCGRSRRSRSRSSTRAASSRTCARTETSRASVRSRLARQVDRDGQRASRPARELLSRLPGYVFPIEQLAGALVLGAAAGDPRARLDRARSDLDPDAAVLADVLHPVRAIPASREHVDPAVVKREPDLDAMRPAGLSSDRREIGEVSFGESLEHDASVWSGTPCGLHRSRRSLDQPTMTRIGRAALFAYPSLFHTCLVGCCSPSAVVANARIESSLRSPGSNVIVQSRHACGETSGPSDAGCQL